MNTIFRKVLHKPFFIKLFNWEYWPFNMVYAPVYIYWLWLCVKARSFFFFNTANPTITNGGFLLESKKKIYDIIPSQYYPPTLFFKSCTNNKILLKTLKNSSLQFPLIGKPDIGGKGRGVSKLKDYDEVIRYANNSKVDFLLQEFIHYENEVGIFYYRRPGQNRGCISGIVEKKFLTVIGDGVLTIDQLLRKDKRFILQLHSLKKMHKDELCRVPNKNERCLLVPYGNHARGAKFIDISFLVDEALTNSIDRVCKQIPGFYYGRLDVRFNTWEELKQGKNFSIIELNGSGSEPTHMYDPEHSIFFAWKEIIRHWDLLYEISILNHRFYKISYMNFFTGIRMLYENNKHVKLTSEEKAKRA
jgi:hypothetical protein